MVALLALSPSVLPGLRPVVLLNAVRAPFHVHPPHSYAMLVVHSYPSTKRASSDDQRSVGEPAPRARTTGPRLPCVLNHGTKYKQLKQIILKLITLSLSLYYIGYISFLCHRPFYKNTSFSICDRKVEKSHHIKNHTLQCKLQVDSYHFNSIYS